MRAPRASCGIRPKRRVKAVVDDHLTRFAWRESLTVTWGPAA
jgi:hypothetical protein